MKQTKIIATISDERCDVDFISELYGHGMNIVRINTAHQSIDGALKIIKNIRDVSDKIKILIDTKGPEIRTTETEKEFLVKSGDTICMKGNRFKKTNPGTIYVSYNDFVKDVSVGTKILIDDGCIELIVICKYRDKLMCVATNSGYIGNRKSVNIPSVHIRQPALSKKDVEYINFSISNNIDFIAHSFVRNKKDVIAIQEILDKGKSSIKIIAKIENKSGVDNIDEILDHVHGVMVARGDLSVEMPITQLPIIQKNIIKKCIKRKKTVIVATQMLHTMIRNPRPTCAEVSDVANAIYDGADAIMLSGETAHGKYPIEAVEIMNQIANNVEHARGVESVRKIGIDV